MKPRLAVLAGVLASLGFGALARPGGSGRTMPLAGLEHPVRVVRDRLGVPHVYARSDHDAFFVNGYLQAQDRFFQMDAAQFFSRRAADGTRSEVLGPGAFDETLARDVDFRTLGLRRAAERSAAAYPAWVMADLQAYADGVNLWLARNPLPPEYAALELTKASVRPWTPVDSIAIFKHLSWALSSGNFGAEPHNTDVLLSYQDVGRLDGFDGTKLFFDDVGRNEPFDHTVSIPPAAASGALSARRGRSGATPALRREPVAAAADVLGRGDGRAARGGSNWWLVSGAQSATGFPLLAGDPHLPLTSPPAWHEIGLTVSGERHGNHGRRRDAGGTRMNVYGVGLPGIPGVVQGFNDHLMWTTTHNPLDDVDFFQERVVVSDGVPVATLYKGVAEPLTTVHETFRANRLDGAADNVEAVAPGARPSGVEVPATTLVVPRLNNGPLITSPAGPAGEETAIGVAYTGFAPTRELEALLRFDRARSLREFERGVHFFDVGTQNWGVADTRGNIAYWAAAEAPLREDLQRGTVAGLPPSFVRDGTGALANGWIPDPHPAPDQALRYKILPFEEMPHLVNPARGFIATANNDPVGVSLDNDPFNQLRPRGGIYYLGWLYATGSREGRITRLLQDALARRGRVSRADMARIQSDVTLVDAQILEPFIQRAYANARTSGSPPQLAALAADPALAEAVRRLGAWDASTPTGIPEGYDAADVSGVRGTPSADEVDNSVAATIYALWRSQILNNTIVATLERAGLDGLPSGYDSDDDKAMVALRRLLETFATTRGVGASGLDFFDAPDVSLTPQAERDLIILTSLRQALELAASPAFAAAFGGSTDQADYRWGKLHRVTFSHPLGPPFSIPPGAGFTDLAPGLAGLSTDGGFDTVDAAQHDARVDSPDGFVYGNGPSRRFVGEATPHGIRATEVIAGGESGEPTDPTFGNQLGLWLTNEAHPTLATHPALPPSAASTELLMPIRRSR